MRVIEHQAYFDEVVAFAKEKGIYEKERGFHALESQLNALDAFWSNDARESRVVLSKDFAPYSFYFELEHKDPNGDWKRTFNGGLLFHGSHDGHGSGDGPTYSVSLTAVTGWKIHT